MILWLNGAFGAGKSQTACEVRRRLPESCVFDTENAGFFIRTSLPPAARPAGFQDLPLWRALTCDMLRLIAERHDGPIIVPMTVTDRTCCRETVEALSAEFDVRHFILWAERETLQKRLASRLEGSRSWAALQMERCLRAFETDITEVKLPTDGLTISQTAEKIADIAGLVLSEDRRSGPRKALDRCLLQLRQIRFPGPFHP